MVLEGFADVAGRQVRYLEAGSGEPVVLLHAFPLSADMWRPQLEHVPDGWRLLTPDLRGFGPKPGDAASSLDEMAGDIARWLEVMHVDRAVIGGLSMGGYVTLALFRASPERFTALILANTKATADTAEGRAARDKMSALVREKGVPAVADQMLPKLLGEASRRSRPELEPRVRRLIESNPVDGIDGAIQAMKSRPDSTAMLTTIDRPVLVVTAAEDSLIPVSEAEMMHRLIPTSRLVTIPGAGHLSNLEAPQEFSAAVADFLRANE